MRPMLFKILLLAYSFSAFTQTLSKEEHCIALEEKLDIKSQLYDTYTNVYLNHLKNCQPPIEYQFSLYKKLLSQLLKEGPSASNLEPFGRVIQHILGQMPTPDVESLQELAQENWKTLSKKTQTENITFNVSPSANYYFTKPFYVTQNTRQIRGIPFHITLLSQQFSSQLSICKNTTEFQHLLNPIHHFLQDTVFTFLQSVNYEQLQSFQQLYTLYYSIHPPQSDTPIRPEFIAWTQLPLSFIEFVSNSVDWSASFFQYNYDWLRSLLSLLKIRILVSETMQTYCSAYQPFLNTTFMEHHYTAEIAKDHPSSKNDRDKIFNLLQENLKEQNEVFFSRSNIPLERDRMDLYFITHSSQVE